MNDWVIDEMFDGMFGVLYHGGECSMGVGKGGSNEYLVEKK